MDLKTWAHGVSICKDSSPSAILLGKNLLGLQCRHLSTLSTFTVDDFFFTLLMGRTLDLKTWTHGVSICKGSSPSAFFGTNCLGLQYRKFSRISTFAVGDVFLHFIDG